MHLLSECSPDRIIAERRLLHELPSLPRKNRVVQRNPLNVGSRTRQALIDFDHRVGPL